MKETYYWIENKDILGNGKGFLEKVFVENFDEYKSLYEDVDQNIHRAVGEECNGYLYYHKETIPNVKRNLGDTKILIMLRNPIDRAYSGYLHLIREDTVQETFEECIEKEAERIREKWWWGFHVVNIGFYFLSVKAYLENFSRVKIMFYEDLGEDMRSFLKEITEFLEVDNTFVFDLGEKYNMTGYLFKNNYLNTFIKEPNVIKNIMKPFIPFRVRRAIIGKIWQKKRYKPEMKRETRKFLIETYKDDILKLQQLVNRDLSHWIKEI